MDVQQRSFWQQTPPNARPAVYAAIVAFLIEVVPFVLLTIVVSIQLQVSPLQVIFGPLPGNPLILWVATFTPPILVQIATALALRQPGRGYRIAGLVGAVLIALVCLIWLLGGGFAIVTWLTTGGLPGDFLDLLGIVFFGVPIAITVLVLNAQSAIRTWRELRRRAA